MRQVANAWVLIAALFTSHSATGESAGGTVQSLSLKTKYAQIRIDERGFIASVASLQSGREYIAPGEVSPLLTLQENSKTWVPIAASLDRVKGELTLEYANRAMARVGIQSKDKYVRFQLLALDNRGAVDNVVWGPLRTTITQLIGDMIGVVHDDNFAIGMMGLDDNTIAGPAEDGDCYSMGYYIHSPDPEKYPVPAQYQEGQKFNVGGDGTSDTAFYSHPEEYFQQVYGNAAKLEPGGAATSLAYHARDRRKSYVHFYSLLPGFPNSKPRHQVSDPVKDVDFIGSSLALYACPSEQALATIENIICRGLNKTGQCLFKTGHRLFKTGF